MINGIETREFGESSDNVVSRKKMVSTKGIEETKINFFNPNQYNEAEDELLFSMEKKEEE